jgi:hypothetical protein
VTFKEILDLSKNRIDELDSTTQIDEILKSAVNDAYINELSRHDKRINKAFIPVINGTATLPDDLDMVESISPSLVKGERRVGNVILSSRDVMFTIIYSYIRETLVNDADVLDISDKFKMLLSTYACYLYFQYRKKTSIAQMFLNDYEMKLAKIFDEDNFGDETIQDVYASGGKE